MHQFFWWSFPIFAVLLSLFLHAPTQIGTIFLMKPMFFCMPLLYIDNECIHYACLVELLLGPYMHKWYSSKKKKKGGRFFLLLPSSLFLKTAGKLSRKSISSGTFKPVTQCVHSAATQLFLSNSNWDSFSFLFTSKVIAITSLMLKTIECISHSNTETES